MSVLAGQTIYAQIDTVSTLPEVSIAIDRTISSILEGGMQIYEKGVLMQGERETALQEFTSDLLRSLLKYNAVAYVLTSKGLPRVLFPGRSGEFVMEGSEVDGYKAAWASLGSRNVDSTVRVVSFNPSGPSFVIVSCVSCLIPIASWWEEVTENLLEADFLSSYTEYSTVLRHGSVIASETPVMRGSPADARSSISHLVGLSMRAQSNGRTVESESLVSKMQTILETIRNQQPPGRIVNRVAARADGTTEGIRRRIPGSSSMPLTPGFAVEPVQSISRNPQYLEMRSGVWLTSISSAFGIPPTRLFGHRGPWDSGSVNRNASNTQVEASYRTQINHYRNQVTRVLSDIDIHGRAAAIANEVEWSLVPQALQTMASSEDESGVLGPYVQYMKKSGSFRQHSMLSALNQESATEGVSTWTLMIHDLAIEIQTEAGLRGVTLDIAPIVEYLKRTKAAGYNKWISEYVKRQVNHGGVAPSRKNVLKEAQKTRTDGQRLEEPMEDEDEVETGKDGAVFEKLFEIVWNKEPGLAALLLALCEQGYVNRREAMRIVLPSLGFTDPDAVERLLNGVASSSTVHSMETEDDEEERPKRQERLSFSGPADVTGPPFKQM